MASSRRSTRKRPPVNYTGQQGDVPDEESDGPAQGEDPEEAASDDDEPAAFASDEESALAERSKKRRKYVSSPLLPKVRYILILLIEIGRVLL